MTSMVPAAQTLSKQQHLHISGDYAGCGTGANYREDFDLMSGTVEGYAYFSTESCLGSDPVVGDQNMAEDESRTNSSLNEAATSSKDLIHQEERDEGWLKLSIGGHAACSHNSKHDDHQANPTARRGSGSIELDLLPGGSTSQQARPLAPIFHVPEFRVPRATSFSTSLFFQHPGSSTSNFPHHQEINWAAFRPIRHNIGSTASSSTSSSSSLMPFGSYFAQPPLQLQSMMDVAGPSLDFRVIDPPRRPHSGIWFMLRASQNQLSAYYISKNRTAGNKFRSIDQNISGPKLIFLFSSPIISVYLEARHRNIICFVTVFTWFLINAEQKNHFCLRYQRTT